MPPFQSLPAPPFRFGAPRVVGSGVSAASTRPFTPRPAASGCPAKLASTVRPSPFPAVVRTKLGCRVTASEARAAELAPPVGGFRGAHRLLSRSEIIMAGVLPERQDGLAPSFRCLGDLSFKPRNEREAASQGGSADDLAESILRSGNESAPHTLRSGVASRQGVGEGPRRAGARPQGVRRCPVIQRWCSWRMCSP